MRFGLNIPTLGPLSTPEGLRSFARAAEARGCHSLWIGDHIGVPRQVDSRYPYAADGKARWPDDLPWPEAFQTLTWVAAETSTIVLGTSVLILPLRSPVAAAHSAATLDWLSGGRLVLGIGTGWLREEFMLLGQPFEGRGARMDEAVEIMRRCWSADPISYQGSHYEFAPFSLNPKPVQGSRLPIICGGHSDLALKRVARMADGWQPYRLSPASLEERKRTLEKYLDECGRGFGEIDFSVRLNYTEPLDEGLVAEYRALGVELLIHDLDFSELTIDDLEEQLEKTAALIQ